VFTVALAAVIGFPILPIGQIALEVGDVSARDVRSPRRATYVSDLQTDDARKRAEASVALIYTVPDGRVARQQMARARAVTDFVRAVRADSYASFAQKQAALAAIQGVSLSSAQAERILTLPDGPGQKSRLRVVNVLDLAHREIREGRRESSRARIPGMVGIRLTEDRPPSPAPWHNNSSRRIPFSTQRPPPTLDPKRASQSSR
jgi:membrane-associated HD superfamily phosphohydrolase